MEEKITARCIVDPIASKPKGKGMESMEVASHLDIGGYSLIYVWFGNLAGSTTAMEE